MHINRSFPQTCKICANASVHARYIMSWWPQPSQAQRATEAQRLQSVQKTLMMGRGCSGSAKGLPTVDIPKLGLSINGGTPATIPSSDFQLGNQQFWGYHLWISQIPF